MKFGSRKIDSASVGLASNMAISGICKPVSMLLGYIYVPIVLNWLGEEKYGIWATLLAIVSWISYFDIGIGNGLRNKLTKALSVGDEKQGQRLISSAYAFIAALMTAAAVIFCIAASFADWNRIFGVRDIAEDLKALVCVTVIFVAVNFVLSICKNVLYALQKASDVSLMELVTQGLNLLGIIAAKSLAPADLFLIALIYGLSMTVTNIIFSMVLYIRNKQLRPRFSEVELNEGKELTDLGLQFFIIQICALVLFTTDNLIISLLYGAADVTPYSASIKLFTAISSVYSAFLAPIWSAATKAKTEGNRSGLKKIIKTLNFLMLPFFAAAVLLTIIFRPVAFIWLGRELNFSDGLILLGGLYCILTIWCNTYSYIANGLELMKMSMVTAVIQASVNIPLSLLFAGTFGMEAAGVLCGTVCAMSISAVVQPIYVYKYICGNQNRKEE